MGDSRIARLGEEPHIQETGDDKVLFKSKAQMDRDPQIGRVRVGLSTINLRRWDSQVIAIHPQNEKFLGWILIGGLPFDLWSANSFERIGKQCGGLLE